MMPADIVLRLRVWPALFMMALLPLVMMLYWLRRIRVRQKLRGLVVRVATPEAA